MLYVGIFEGIPLLHYLVWHGHQSSTINHLQRDFGIAVGTTERPSCSTLTIYKKSDQVVSF